MIYGLRVEHLPSGYYGMLVVELGWAAPPPIGATWWCCRRADVDAAGVTGHTWAGLGDDPDVWVHMSCPEKRMIGHLANEHGFSSGYL